MLCKASLLVVLYALLVGASPVEEHQAGCVKIPLSKRSSLTKSDGTFDHQKAIAELGATRSKHLQNLINYERNSGNKAFGEVGTAVPQNLQRRQKESLTLASDGSEWLGTMSIGTPPQQFVVQFDTGSSDLWVASSSCRDAACAKKNKYNPSSSSTKTKQSGEFSIRYGDNSTVSGPVYADTVAVAGVQVQGQFFSPVTNLSSAFETQSVDGIVGMAFPTISNLNATPFINMAFKQGHLRSNEFSFKLTSGDSSLFLGGSDASLFKGSPEFHPVGKNPGFWFLTQAAAFVGSTQVISQFQTIIDSGTTIIYGPQNNVEALYKAVPNSKLFDSENGFYSFPCSSIPSISFSWGSSGKKWTISPDNFNLGFTKAGSDECVGAIAQQDIGLPANSWVLGDSFMSNVYTTFSFDQNAVGFAELA